MYVAGRVKAISTYGFVTFMPVLNGSELGAVEWTNYDFYTPFLEKVMLSASLKSRDIPKEGMELSVMAEMSKGEVLFRSVPSVKSGNFICQQREYFSKVSANL